MPAFESHRHPRGPNRGCIFPLQLGNARVPGECSERFFSASGTRPGTQRKTREAQYREQRSPWPLGPGSRAQERARPGHAYALTRRFEAS
jgi:hypothetical protein